MRHSCSPEGRRFLSRPIKIHWAGWETDTVRLQQAGWSLSAEEDVAYGSMMVAMRHDGYGMRGVTDVQRVDYYRLMSDYGDAWRDISLRARLGSHSRVELVCMGEPRFRAIDAMPQTSEFSVRTLDDIAHFATPLARTREIMVPEPSVSDLLAKILELQEPAKNAYFRDLVDRDRRGEHLQEYPRRKFHAQIVSLAA